MGLPLSGVNCGLKNPKIGRVKITPPRTPITLLKKEVSHVRGTTPSTVATASNEDHFGELPEQRRTNR